MYCNHSTVHVYVYIHVSCKKLTRVIEGRVKSSSSPSPDPDPLSKF